MTEGRRKVTELQDLETGRLDIQAMQKLIERYPDAFERFRDEVAKHVVDRYGRSIAKTDKVVTPQGEDARVLRIDQTSRRVLVELPGGKTRMIMAHRLEVKRGRPRKTSQRRRRQSGAA